MSENDLYLKESAREALNFSVDKRIEFIRRERWIGYPIALEALEILEDLLTHPKKHRMPDMLIVSETNNGKTTIINRFQGKHPSYDNPEGDTIVVPILIVQAPPVPDEGRFYDQVLRKLGAPFREKDKPGKKQFEVMMIFQHLMLRMLIIDEIHDILAGSRAQQRNFRNAIKHLGNELKIPIVGCGIEQAYNAIQTDSQLANRFKPFFIPKWKIGDGVKPEKNPYLKLLASFERMLPLANPSNLAQPEIALRILSMSDGLIGEIAEILRLAAIKAIKTKKELIDLKILDQIRWVPPAERKWKFSYTGNGKKA
jgi:hypothetical protein